MTQVPTFKDALLEAAADHLAKAEELEASARRHVGEGRSFCPSDPRVTDLIVAAKNQRWLGETARAAAEAMWF